MSEDNKKLAKRWFGEVWNKAAATPSSYAICRRYGRDVWVKADGGQMKDCRWLRPKSTGQFEFLEWTEDRHLRHSRFVGKYNDAKQNGAAGRIRKLIRFDPVCSTVPVPCNGAGGSAAG